MVIISKPLFDERLSHIPCNVVIHPGGESCIGVMPSVAWNSLIGSAKFYALIYAIQLLTRGNKLKNKSEWIKMGELYARSTIYGMMVSTWSIPLSCSFRALNENKFNYYSYTFLPFLFTGLFVYLEPLHRRGLVVNLFSNLLIEYWLNILQRKGFIKITTSIKVLMFMVGSSLLFYLMRLEGEKKKRTPLFWLFTPEKVRQKEEGSKKVCPHNGSCTKHVLKGIAGYFGVGLGFTLAKLILPKIMTPIKAISSIRRQHLKLALFFSSYIGIYRIVICYLCRKRGFDSATYALPAGYLAGLSFIFNPNMGLAIASLTAAFKLYSTILYEKGILPSNIPLPELLYCFCQGILFNARLLHPDVCPSYLFNLMDTVSNGNSKMIVENIDKIFKNVL